MTQAVSPVFIGGALWLDFLNTRLMTTAIFSRCRSTDLLGDHGKVRRWFEAAGLAPADRFSRERARALRGTLTQVFDLVSNGRPVPGATLAGLNAILALRHECRRIAECEGRFELLTVCCGTAPAIVAIVESAASALARDEPTRLRRCAGRHCRLVFRDASRHGNRQFCRSDVCGNRARVRCHYHRHNTVSAAPAADRARTHSDHAMHEYGLRLVEWPGT